MEQTNPVLRMSEPQRNRILQGWLLEALWILLQIVGMILFIPLPAHRTGRRGRILIVTDLFTSPLFYVFLRSALIKQGYAVYFYYNFSPFRSLKESARRLSRHIEKEGLNRCVLLGHGVGGLLPLALPDEGRKRVYHLLGLGTPFHGTTLVRHLSFIPSFRDVTSRSDFLLVHRMNALLFDDFSPFSAWSDEWIVPGSLSRFGQGRDLIVDFPGRLNLVISGENVQAVVDFLGHSHPTTAVEKAQIDMSREAKLAAQAKKQGAAPAEVIRKTRPPAKKAAKKSSSKARKR